MFEKPTQVKRAFLYLHLTLVYLVFLLSPANASYSLSYRHNDPFAIKPRLTRYGGVENCGKRKRNVENRKCFRQCTTDSDCRGSKRRCLCDGECGLSCVRITTACTKVNDFKNGVVAYHPDNYFGSQLIYECNPGYSLIGNKIRVCEGDGWWSGISPVCVKEVFCDYPPTLANAFPNVQINNETRYKIDTEVEYQCDIGYTSANDLNRIICLENGKWSELKFQCTRINCGQPENIQNGLVKANDYHYSSIIEYSCSNGFQIVNGDYLRECTLEGKWSGRKPSCIPVDCGEPPYLNNAIASFNSTQFESQVIYSCINENFYVNSSNPQISCQATGNWPKLTFECIEKTCQIDSDEYGKPFYNIRASKERIEKFVYPIDTILDISCNPGYEFFGANRVSCMNGDTEGEWSKALPVCKKEMYCPFISPPTNGLMHSSQSPNLKGYSLNTTIQFSCHEGYRLEGNHTVVCVLQGSNVAWKGEHVSCQKTTTTRKTTTSTTTLTTTTSATSRITSSKQTTTTTRTLLNTQDSNESNQVDYINLFSESDCRLDSSILISFSNLVTTVQSFEEYIFLNISVGKHLVNGESIKYKCRNDVDSFYFGKCLNGTIYMQKNCNYAVKSKPCTPPPKINNGYNKFGSLQHGSKALYQCFNGYELTHSNGELYCIDGEWIGSIPTCTKVNCGFPGILKNGKIFYIGTLSEYTYQPYMNTVGQNKQIRYECDKDYKLIGPNGSTCINGNWKPSLKLVKCVKEIDPRMQEAELENISELVLKQRKTFQRRFKQRESMNDKNAEIDRNQNEYSMSQRVPNEEEPNKPYKNRRFHKKNSMRAKSKKSRRFRKVQTTTQSYLDVEFE